MRAERDRIVAAVLVRGGKILLGFRSPDRRWFPACWDVPGGHVEPGESGPAALRRELREELGIDASVDERPEDFCLVDEHYEGRFWVIRAWSREITNAAPQEHTELRWFSPQELDGITLADPRYPATFARVLADEPGFGRG